MKTTTIPAQITTVEDTIAGNLTLSQILLLIAPVFGSTAVYAILPPNMSMVLYKLILMISVSVVFMTLAIRIRGKLVVNWLKIMTEYALRPHTYVFNKNTSFSREIEKQLTQKVVAQVKNKAVIKKKNTTNKDFDFETLARDERVNVRLTKKGLLLVKNI